MRLFLHLLMLALLSAASARVVQDFEKDCGQFFANGKSPTKLPGKDYEQICQTLNGVPYYATFYDTQNKIPVYSAYTFEGFKDCKRLDKWHIEPQLDDNNASPNMQFESDVKNKKGSRQALNKDYEKSGQDKGHLEPVFQANSQNCADATFTLTNAAPQNPSFNRGQWRVLEDKMAKDLTDNCLTKKYSVYIVTGVVPGTGKPINNRVNVPSHFWTAYCCLNQNKKCQITGGFIGENTKNTPKTLTVTQLESELTNLYKVSFELFESSSEPPLKKLKTGK